MASAWRRLGAGQVTPGHTQPRWPQSMVSCSHRVRGLRVQDPDGLRITLAEVPAAHPSAVTRDRRDRRNDEPPAA
jgi:hypothetical protein